MVLIRPPPPPPEWLQPFLGHCRKRRFANHTDIMRPGEAADSLFFILSGSVTVLSENDQGREIVLTYLNKGDFVGEMAMFLAKPSRSVRVRARTACELAEISYPRFEALLQGELHEHTRDILFAIGRQLTERLIQTSRKVGTLAFLDVTGRIAATLLELCKQPDAMTHPDGMQIRITRQELGRVVGCSREMAGRVLKSLEEQGLLHARGKTIVVFNAR
ncbi:MAG: cAMP-activated global transcriptional regulator CRP [Gammaproteobacteria bacterium]|jgi:CRP/FNR family cyclic AMP-dependent transcriptional regulator|nr:cAMP-activated global transcriptional regulator CRP [Gammaproteobacteria bacterium]